MSPIVDLLFGMINNPEQETMMRKPDSYPVTRYGVTEPEAPPDLNDKEVRERLSHSAIRSFLNIMKIWKVRDEDARQLLAMSNGPYYEMKKQPDRVLDGDRLYRISYLLGIFQALNVVFSPPLSDEWVQLPNTNRIFGGVTPLVYMINGGIPAMQMVRRLLDAWQFGQ